MKKTTMILLAAAAAAALPVARAAEPFDESLLSEAPIVSVAFFKNGLAAVTRRVDPAGRKTVLVSVPEAPLHGTFWTDADAPVEISAGSREIRRHRDASADPRPWGDTFGGRTATVRFRASPAQAGALRAADAADAGGRVVEWPLPAGDDATETVELTGTVLGGSSPAAREAVRPEWEYPFRAAPQPAAAPWAGIALRLGNGTVLRLPASYVAAISSDGANEAETVSNIQVWEIKGAGRPFLVSYLAKGGAWAPSYRLSLGANGDGSLDMSAEIRNELDDFRDAEVTLVSGVPNLQCRDAKGLLAGGTDLSAFFRGLRGEKDPADHEYMSQRIVSYRPEPAEPKPAPQLELASVPEVGAAAGMHFRNVGKRTLRKGESLRIPLGSARTKVKPFVDWTMNPSHNGDGKPVRPLAGYEGEFRACATFRNPFDAPLTTGPILVEKNGRPLVQTTLPWCNPDHPATLVLTKETDVAERAEETETEANREDIPRFRIGNRECWKKHLVGRLSLRNYGAEPAEVRIERPVVGIVTSTTVDPVETKPRASGSSSINQVHDLRWTLTLAPGESREIGYEYDVNVLERVLP